MKELTKTLNKVSVACSIIMLSACGGDSGKDAKPTLMTDTSPDAVRQTEFLPVPISNSTDWSAAGAVVDYGTTYTWRWQQMVPGTVYDNEGNPQPGLVNQNLKLTGLDTFATVPVEVTSNTGNDGSVAAGNPGVVMVPDDNRCPADADYMVPEKVLDNIFKFAVNGATNVASAKNNDTLAASFVIPKNRYGITYDATVKIGENTLRFAVTTKSHQDLHPDPLQFSSVLDKDKKPLIIGKVTSANNAVTATGLDDNQLLLIPLAIPVANMDLLYKRNAILSTPADQTFAYNGNTDVNAALPPFVATAEGVTARPQGEVNRSMWTRVTKNVEGLEVFNTYNKCATVGDTVNVYLYIPNKTFDKTYTGSLPWIVKNASGAEETINYSFSFTTRSRDVEPDPIVIPKKYDIPVGKDFEIPVTVSGINDAVPISISGTGVSYSINGGPYTTASGMIDEGQTLTLKYEASSEFYRVYQPTLTVAGQTITGFARTIGDPTKPKLSNTLKFPTTLGATTASTVTLRGVLDALLPEGYTEPAPVLNASMITIKVGSSLAENPTYDATTKEWTYAANLAAGTNEIIIDAAIPLPNTQGIADASPITIYVEKLAAKTDLFPTNNVNPVRGLTDVTVDMRGIAPRLYFTEGLWTTVASAKAVYYFDIASIPSGLSPLKQMGYSGTGGAFEAFVDNGGTRGIQINPYEKNLGDKFSLYITGGQGVNSGMLHAYLKGEQTLLKGTVGQNYTKGASPNSGQGSLPQVPQQLAIADKGASLLVTGDGNVSTLSGLNLYPLNQATDLIGKFVFTGNTATFSKVTTQFTRSVSVDVFTGADGKEYFLVLTGNPINNNTLDTVAATASATNLAANNLWIIENTKNFASLSPAQLATTAKKVTLRPTAAAAEMFNIYHATSIAVDSLAKKAYISCHGINGCMTAGSGNSGSSSQILVVDLSNIVTPAATPVAPISNLPATLSPENAFGKLASIVNEGFPFLIGVDNTQNAIYAIDQVTGEKIYLMKANARP